MSFKRILSLVLVLCMVLSFFPASAFADNDAAEEEGIEEVVEEPAAAEQSEENNENPPEAAPEEGAGETEEPASSEEEAAAPAVEEAVEEEEEVVEEEVVAEAQTVSEEAMEAGAVCKGRKGSVVHEYLDVQDAIDDGNDTIQLMQDVELAKPLSISAALEFLGTGKTLTGNITINATEGATVALKDIQVVGTISLEAGELAIAEADVNVDAIEASGGKLSISNGNYRTATAKSVDVVGNVTGGKFTEGITDYLCADGYAANASGTVVQKTLKAQIGEGLNRKRFATFGAAAAAAGESDTVILLASSWTGETPANTFTLGDGKTLVVDKNGYKFGTPKPETAAYMVEESSVGTVFTYKSVLVIATITTGGQATPTDVPFASFEGAVAARTDSDTVINLKQNAEYTMTVGDTLKVKLGDKTLAVSAPEGYVVDKTGPEGDRVTTYKVVGTYRVVEKPATPTDASWPVTAEGTDYKDTELDAAVTAAMKKDNKVLVLVGSDASVTFADGDFLNVYAGSKVFTAVAAPGVKPVVGNPTAIDSVLRYAPTGTYKAKVSAEGKEDQYFDNFISNGALPYANKNGGTVSFMVGPASGQEYTMVADAEKTLVIDWADYNDEAIEVKAPAGFILKTATEGTVTTYSLTAVVATITNVGNYETFADAAVAAAEDPDNRKILLLADIAPYTMDPKLATKMIVNHNGHSLTVEAPAGWVLKDDGKLVPETRTIGVTNRSGEHTYSITQPFTYTFKPENGQDDIVRTVYGDTGLTDAPTAEKVGYKELKWVDENGEYYPATPTDVKPTSDKTYTAEWTARKYRFIAESMATPTDTYDYTRVVDFGEEITAPPDVPVAQDKTFEYWAYLNKKDLWIGGKTPTYTRVDFPFTLDAEALDRLLLVSPDPDSRYKDKDEGVFYFYAVFKDDVYSVTFDADGGTFRSSKSGAYVSSIENIDLEVGADLEYPNTEPVREGYDFLGWNYEGGFIPGPDTIRVLPSKMPAEDRNYVAQWEAVNYAINYTDTSDKTLPKSFTVEDLPLTINEISYPGYTFDGWTSTVLGITSPEMVAVIPAGTATATDLKANWTKNEYAIKFDLAGGAFQAGDPVYTSYNVDNAFTIPQPVKDGFTFIGWTGTGLTEPTAVVYIAAGTTGDLEFTANWSVNPVTVLINYNDGGQTKNDKYIVEFGTPINQPTIPAYEGHSLIGWSLTPAGGQAGYAVDEFPYVLPEYAESVTLTGQWKTNVHSVTFQAGEGAFPGGSKEAVQPSVAFGTEMNYDRIVIHPERTGYGFDGWVLRDGEKAPATMPDEDLVLYASYVPAEYDVTYSVATNTDAKIINPETGREVDSYTFKLAYGETLPEAPAAVYQGHEYVWVEDHYGYNAPAEMPARNLNFTAEWSGLSYTVKFVANGGTINDMHNDPVEEFYVTGEYGDPFPWNHAFKPTLEGYKFHSWMTEDGTHFDYLPATFPAENTTFTVAWDINKWNVTFSGGGAKIVNPETGIEVNTFTLQGVEYGADVVYPEEPVLEGYTFNAWNEAVDGFTPVTTMPDRNLAFVADWEAEEHTVTLDANGGKFVNVLGEESETFTVTGKFGDSVDYPDDPELEGYTLVAWADEEGNKVDLRTRTILAEDVTYTAVWEIKQTTVTYAVNGGTAVDPITGELKTVDFDIVYNYGDELLLPKITKEGHEFKGWVSDKFGWNYPKTIPDVDKMSFYAVWKGENFTLSFDANGGLVTTKALNYDPVAAVHHTDTVPFYSAVVNSDGLATLTDLLPTDKPEKEGYTFESWIDETGKHWTHARLKDLATEFPYEDKAFVANWILGEYDVTFNANGGKVIDPATLDKVDSYTANGVQFGSDVEYPEDPVLEGYTFVGWYETIDGYKNPATMPAHNLSFTAVWEKEEHTVTLDANGGKFVDALGEEYDTVTVTGKFGESFTYPADPKLEGYTLVGWADEDGNKVDTRTYTIPSVDVTYTAVWQIKKVTVTYAVRGGTAIHPNTYVPTTIDFDVVYNFGDELVLPTITRDGFDFGGWVEDTYGWNYPATIPDVTKMVFKAVWVGEDFTLSFDADGGTVETRALSYSLATHTDIVPEYTAVVNADPATLADAVRKALPIAGTSTNPNPVKEGYSFESWIDENDVHWTDADLATLATNFPYVNKSFKANWTVNKYQVKFDGMGGDLINPNTGLPAPGQEYTQKVEFGTAIPFPADPVREGYTFVGWAEMKDGYGYNHPKTMPVPKTNEGLVFVAQWKANEYTVSYDANGGIMVTTAFDTTTHTDKVSFYSITGKAGDPMINPLSITREGYKFHGWVDQDGKHYEAGQLPATIPAKNTMYVAIWEVESYWVTFDAINGRTYAAKAELMNPNTGLIETDGRYEQKVVFGTEIPFPADPVLKGYTFVGWAEVQDKYGYNHPETMPVPKTDYGLVFEAQWVPEEHTITFDANGGEFTSLDGRILYSNPISIVKPTGTAIADSEYAFKATLEGYNFKYWLGSDGKTYGGTGYTVLPTTMPAEDLTLTAVWDIQEYYVYFVPRGGQVTDPITLVKQPTDVNVRVLVKFGDPIPYAEVERKGYEFDTWVEDYYGKVLPETAPALPNGRDGLYFRAVWKGLDYTVTFDGNGGTIETTALDGSTANPQTHKDYVESYTVIGIFGDAIKSPTNVGRDGYTFHGWVDQNGKHYNFGQTPTTFPAEDMVFTAQWTPLEQKVTFNANNGMVVNPFTGVIVPTFEYKVKSDEAITYPADPVRTGYEFKGWQEDGDLKLGFLHPETMPAKGKDLVFYAQWAPIPNTVVYNANGGTVLNKLGQPVEVLTIEAPTGEAIYVPTVLPVRYGYDLVGWFDHNDNKILTFDDLAHTMPAEGETYTAMWVAKDINVTFYYDFNGVVYKQNTVKFGDLVTRPVDPIVTGYDFLGWYTYIDGGRYLEEFDFSKPVESEEDIHLVGKWSVSLWTVSFDSNGGRNTIPDQIVEHGKKAAEPKETMYRNGYTFVGWVVRNDNGTLADTFYDFINTAVTKDTQLVAIWQGKEVTLRWTDRNVYFVDQKVHVGDFIIRPEFDNYYFQQLIRDGRTDRNGVHYRLDPDNLWDPMPSEKVEEDWGDHFTYMLNWIQQNEVSLYNENGQKTKAFVDDGMTLGEAIDAGLISAPSKPGYKVVWTDESGNPVDESTLITEGMILKASYVPFVPVVTFKVGDSVYKKVEVAYEGTVEKPADPIPTELGVQFAGWVEEGSPVLFDFSTPITDNLTLTAKWAPLVPTEKLVEDFVKRAYNLMLGRDADPDGLKYYVDELTSGRLSGAQMVSNFMNSPEFAEIAKDLSNEEIVAIIYETMLDRIPSAEEAAYHAANLEKGYSYNAITNCFSQSPEFLGICEEAGIEAGTAAEMWRDKNILVTAFVKRNYKLTLLRDAAGEELDYYCEILLQKTLTPQQVAHNFVFSPECVARGLSDQQFITMLYNLYMDRDPDASGLAYYMGLLANGVSREQIDANFGASPEFAEIVKSYGL